MLSRSDWLQADVATSSRFEYPADKGCLDLSDDASGGDLLELSGDVHRHLPAVLDDELIPSIFSTCVNRSHDRLPHPLRNGLRSCSTEV